MVTSEAVGKMETAAGTYMWCLEAWTALPAARRGRSLEWFMQSSDQVRFQSTGAAENKTFGVSSGGRPWGHKPGQYCRNRHQGAKSGTRNEESAEPIITTGEGEESPRMILLYLPYMTGDQFHSILRQNRTGENIRGSFLFLSSTHWHL